ncbi:MAG TPA: SMC-Scp complex subunit ScpB [Thermoanaerobaculia bacterium]|nr:SMC-Scp complex subunit ScpB [Thermoanaerobaculia bacterium]
MNGRDEMEAAVEAILFVSGEPVPLERMLAVFPEDQREEAAAALQRVVERYRPAPDQLGRGVMIDEAAGGLRLVTRPELHLYLKRFFDVSGQNRLTMAAIETLAIIAYRQPITAPEIQDLRGKNSSAVLKTLLERRLARISGRREVVGRPFLYSTTRDFLLHFGLRSLDDLPPLEELEEALRGDGDFSGATPLPGEDREEQLMRQLSLVDEQEVDRDEESSLAQSEPGDGLEAAPEVSEATVASGEHGGELEPGDG